MSDPIGKIRVIGIRSSVNSDQREGRLEPISIEARGIVLFPSHGVKMIKSDRSSWGGKNLYIWSRSDPRQGTNGFADLFTFMGRIYGTNVRSGAYVKV